MPVNVLDGLNTYEPCEKHKNGHSNHCKDCGEEALRELLKEIANSKFVESPDKIFVTLDCDLWKQIVPLRTPPKPAGEP
jgi:hypothetical protein